MQAELIIDVTGPPPNFSLRECLEAQAEGRDYRIPSKVEKKKGTIIDNPMAFWLVKMGCAKPADEECRIMCPWWTDEWSEMMLETYKKTAAAKLTGDPKYDAE